MSDRPDRLDGKRIVVTGAASGFGRLIVGRAVARGSSVVAADLDEAGLDALADDLAGAAGEVAGAVTDVTRLADVRAAVDACVERFDGVDAIVNNAGVMPLAFLADHAAAAEAWDRCIDVNVKGVLHGMIAVHDQMVAQGRGQVVNLSSIYGNHPVVGAAVYGATKAAVNVMSEAFRAECQGVIKVTVIKPTGVPGTGLGGGVVNPAAIVGILGQNAPDYVPTMQALRDGTIDPSLTDPELPGYVALAPEHIADTVIHVLDQPWGVSIGDVTVRATGDRYIL